MKYMSFNSSCSYCCLANLLETYGVDKEDRDLALGCGLPYLFSYDEEENCYLAGAMLQGSFWFNHALNPLGFTFFEELLPKEEVPAFLDTHIPCMTGLKSQFGKHAMVYTGQRDGRYLFLNPHRPDDGQDDTVSFSPAELQDALSEVNAIGWLTPSEPTAPTGFSLYTQSLTHLESWQAAVHEFCSAPRTADQITAAANPLFRPLAIDALAMMELLGETELANDLRVFRQEAMTLFRSGDCRPDTVIDLPHLDKTVKSYRALIRQARECTPVTAQEFRTMNVKLRGYAMPDDNAPDFYKRCKVSEALNIMKEHMNGMPEEFYNYKFKFHTEDEEFLFKVPREFNKVYLGCTNKFHLTRELVKEALGME